MIELVNYRVKQLEPSTHGLTLCVAYPRVIEDTGQPHRWPNIYADSGHRLKLLIVIIEQTDTKLSLKEWNERFRPVLDQPVGDMELDVIFHDMKEGA